MSHGRTRAALKRSSVHCPSSFSCCPTSSCACVVSLLRRRIRTKSMVVLTIARCILCFSSMLWQAQPPLPTKHPASLVAQHGDRIEPCGLNGWAFLLNGGLRRWYQKLYVTLRVEI